MTDMSQQRL